MSEIALEFEGIIDDLLEIGLRAGAGPETDLTAGLTHEKVWGRPLSNEEVASILRNWTVGEIGTISAALGILAHYLAEDAELRDPLRACRHADADRHERECDKLLHGVPFVMLSLSAATRRQSRERIYHEAKKWRCMRHTRCREVRAREIQWTL